MGDYLFLVPIALVLGFVGLAAFFWTLRNGQYDDLEGSSQRVFLDEQDRPIPDSSRKGNQTDRGAS